MIKNKGQLTNSNTKDALDILHAGLVAASPAIYLDKFIKKKNCPITPSRLSKFNHTHIVSIGKAADAMATHLDNLVHSDGGIIIIPKTYSTKHINKKFQVFKASHPIPDNSSLRAATKLVSYIKNTPRDDYIIFLISGGASSLVCLPWGITLEQKQQLTQALLKSGAFIHEINAIRKHLSQIKGGRLIEHLKCPAVSCVMSDVVCDDLTTIASGLTYCDKSTFSDCIKITKKYKLENKIPQNILRHLKLGVQKKIPETPKSPKIPNYIIASNKDCVNAMVQKARKLHYTTTPIYNLSGGVSQVAKKIIRLLGPKVNSCVVFGGEPTVRVKGSGTGGRNQELVLHIMKLKPQAVACSVGTDGIDGNTKYAGAISYSFAPYHIITKYIKNNDSYSFFKKYGGLIKTGPTHTNLLDIGVVMIK